MQRSALWRRPAMFREFYRGWSLRDIRMRRYWDSLYYSCTRNILAAENAEWQAWGQWSECSASCGHGTWLRARACSEPLFGGEENCPGNSTEAGLCEISDCPTTTTTTTTTSTTSTVTTKGTYVINVNIYPSTYKYKYYCSGLLVVL